MAFWKDKVVWVTGASSGIGESLARKLNAQGASMILSARNIEKLRHIADDLDPSGKHVEILAMDVSQTDQATTRAAEAIQFFGHLDAIIHNAGISQRDTAFNSSLKIDQNLMAVNYLGPVALTKALLPHFVERQAGFIAVTSSVAAKLHTPLRSAYCSSKAALHGFFNAVRAEHHKDGIQVTIVCPGFVQTDISRNAMIGDGSTYDKVDEAIAKGIPVDVCTKRYLKAIADGRSEVVIAGTKERFGLFVNRFFPAAFRYMVRNMKVT